MLIFNKHKKRQCSLRKSGFVIAGEPTSLPSPHIVDELEQEENGVGGFD